MTNLIEKQAIWYAADKETRRRKQFLLLCLDATIVVSVACLGYMYHDQLLSFVDSFIH